MLEGKFGTVHWVLRAPPVYRLLERAYVDEFFSTGRIRLSSFQRFGEHSDEARYDAEEGQSRVSIAGKDGKGMVQFVVARPNGYVLSGTTRDSPELRSAFGVDSCFRINNTVAFAVELARVLPQCIRVFEGPCEYDVTRHVTALEDAVLERAITPEGLNSTAQLIEWTDRYAFPRMMFLKPERYVGQHEYRFIWECADETPSYIDVVCPAAVQHCARVEPAP